MPDVIVVGSGLGGLSAAVALASRGLLVEVVEAFPRLGGKANIQVVDGVEFDTGPSVLTLPHVFAELFTEAGTRLEDELTLVEPDPAFRYVYPDGVELDVFVDPERTAAQVKAVLGKKAETEFRSFLSYSKNIWEKAAPEFVLGPAPTWWRAMELGPRILSGFMSLDPFRTMSRAIDAQVSTPHLRALFKRYATYNGSDPRSAPATLNCIAHVELALGGFGVEGGIYEVVRALYRVGARLGVRFHTNSAVEGLVVEDGRVAGVRLGGEVLEASRGVVSNVDVAHLAADLLPEQHRVVTPAEPPSMSGWTGVLRSPRQAGRTAHTVVFPEHYEDEFADIFDHDRPPVDPTVYVCAQEVCHRRQGWADEEPLFVMANAPAEPADQRRPEAVWAKLRAAVRGRLDEQGIAPTDAQMVWERSPSDLAALFPRSRGSIYGASSNTMFAAFKRPTNRVSKLPGLYLATGSAHPGGGMPMVAQSGKLAAAMLVDDQADRDQLGVQTTLPRVAK